MEEIRGHRVGSNKTEWVVRRFGHSPCEMRGNQVGVWGDAETFPPRVEMGVALARFGDLGTGVLQRTMAWSATWAPPWL